MTLEEFQALLSLVDNILSLALLIGFVWLFIKGELISRVTVRDVITRTVQEVLRELQDGVKPD